MNSSDRLLGFGQIETIIPDKVRVTDSDVPILMIQHGHWIAPVDDSAAGTVFRDSTEQIGGIASLVSCTGVIVKPVDVPSGPWAFRQFPDKVSGARMIDQPAFGPDHVRFRYFHTAGTTTR